MDKKYQDIIIELSFILKRYNNVKRATMNCFRFSEQNLKPEDYIVGDINFQESLLEHVGMLPVLAAYFHPLIDDSVNLGESLEMLAIHDIGELITGDENCFTKISNKEEEKAALNILNKKQHKIYKRFDALKCNESRFAKSIDKIAPDILDIITPIDITKKRLKVYANINPQDIPGKIREKKSPYMQWSLFFSGFHEKLIQDLENKFTK